MSRASYGRHDDHRRPSSAHHFSLSESDFERDAVLKRRRHLSPPRAPVTSAAPDNSIAMRVRARSKSKSRGRTLSSLRRLPSVEGQEFFALGRSSKSKPRSKSQTVTATSSSSDDRELEADMERTEKKLRLAKKDLGNLEEEMASLQKRVELKKYEVMDLQIVLDGLQKRKELAQQFKRNSDAVLPPAAPASRSHRSEEATAASRPSSARASKRPCIVDEEEDDDEEDDVMIVDDPRVKMEIVRPSKDSSSRRSSGTSRRVSPDAPAPAASNGSSRSSDSKSVNSQMTDNFWGRVDIAKLLVQPRIRHIPDGSVRKGRHLAFNPIQQDVFATSSDDGGLILWNYARQNHEQDVFATSSDDGGLILWNYARQNHEVTKVVSFAPTSFRQEAQCPEGIAWSPDGERLAIAFRDPLANMSEFCVVRLHQLTLTDSQRPQVLPRDRVKSKTTTHHSRGISAIEWVPTGHGDRQGSRGLITAGSDHRVVLWEEHESTKSHSDFKSRVLHEEHRSDVRAICMHSERKAIYTGGLDGLVVRYDMNAHKSTVIMERRRPQISKINAILENPHNPNLLLVSSVEQAEHNLLLHDLREKYDSRRSSTMTLTWMRSSDAKSMSQYIVPRWSPGGFHVSCGSTTGLVNIWDVRVRSPQFPLVLPQQAINVHQKQVLHATWHPRYDAMFSVSHDRNLGLLTFR
ncbi:hypothetical protein P43SY_008595 [Pythium insidiosum]|uniref:Uncharacterized protein n=1 Tax=Pythium insidiosum TaxID=114742 RepID=A0AAD5LAX1_PYTIN|nr:hypothetical protein P43SY_008595 [Pythium insidiosum]